MSTPLQPADAADGRVSAAADGRVSERRSAPLEVRAVQGRRLEGYAAVFNAPTRIGSSFDEVVVPGAFRATLASGADILGLLDHDASKVLGRTRSQTLKLAEDTRGLHFEIALGETTAARDALAMAERGDLGGASFAFMVPKGGDHWVGRKRELRSVDLVEVSIISSFPAYAQTVVAVRGLIGAQPAGIAYARRWLETAG